MEATLIKPDYTALKERVSLVRTRLTMECPFFGWLALKVQPVVVGGDHPVKTAGITRDRTMFLNADFCTAQTDAQLAGLVCHEVLHLAYLCFERQGSRNAMVMCGIPHTVEAGETPESISTLAGVTVEDLLLANNLPEGTVLRVGQEITVGSATVSLWNVSHDYVINRMIEAFGCSGIQLPPGGLLDDKWNDHAAEEVYDILLEEMAQDGRGQGRGPGKKGESGLSPSWGHDDIRSDLGGKKMTPSEQRADDNYWKVAIVEAGQVHQEAKGQGSLPGELLKMIEDIVDPKVPWVDVLSRWVGENGRKADFTYSRPHRRSESVGEYLPSMKKHGVDDLVVLWDTSGSMYGQEKRIMSEVIGICEDLRLELRVICADTQVCSDQTNVTHPEDVIVRGGGGSNFIPAFDLLTDEGYQGVVIAFTDGYISCPEVKPTHLRDCLWVIGPGDVDPTEGKWGQVLQVDAKGFAV